jgi:PAS domain S-box-containing protein
MSLIEPAPTLESAENIDGPADVTSPGHPSFVDRIDLTQRWHRALIRSGSTSYSAAEVRQQLFELLDKVLHFVADNAAGASAAHIGSALVEIGYATPEALGATLQLFNDTFAHEPRSGALLGGIAEGFAAAARNQILNDQEASRSAVLAENRRAWEALRRQVALLDLAPDAIMVRQAGSARIAFWNHGAEALYGWSRDEALGQSAHTLLHTETPLSMADIEAIVFDEGHWEGEFVHTRRDGTRLIVSSRWAGQWDDSGQPLACLEINTDITARKRIEEVLREREASLELAQSVAHMGSWEFNIATHETSWSPEAYRLLGYAAGEVQPSLDAYLRAVLPEDLSIVRRGVEDALEGNAYSFEHRARGLDEEVRVLQSRTEVGRDASGRPVRLVGTLIDVTDRKRAEAERLHLIAEQAARTQAEAERERFAFLAEASAQLASTLDFSETLRKVAELLIPSLADACTVDILREDGQVQRVAQAGLAQPPEAQMEHYWSSATESHPLVVALRTGKSERYADRAELAPLLDAESLQGLASIGIQSLLVAPLVARDRVLGAITWFACETRGAYTTVQQDLADELARRCAIAMDNARLHAEAQHATQLRDEFLSVAAHELKTPMTTLRGYTQVLSRTLSAGQTPPQSLLERSVTHIDVQSAKLVKLTEQLLDVSRLEAGKLRVSLTLVDAVALVRGIADSIQETTDRHTIQVIAPDTCAMMADPVRLEQVVANLIGNAVKYSPDGGRVLVSLSTPDASLVQFGVRDWGLGIPQDRRANLFDRFYQAHGDGHYGGLGLGLYISREIVELHRGTLEARFPEDGGSSFVATLPRGAAPL